MLVEERRQRFLDLISSRGFVALADLAESVQASESTIRRDLDYWHQQGVVRRTHGGAIYVGAESAGNEAVITVRDTGVGIPPDLLPHVFEMFVQGENAPEDGQTGLGLGLTLAQDGRIWFTGTTTSTLYAINPDLELTATAKDLCMPSNGVFSGVVASFGDGDGCVLRHSLWLEFDPGFAQDPGPW